MMLLRNGLEAIFSKAASQRPPATVWPGAYQTGLTGGSSSLLSQLNQQGNSAWLFAVVSRIARSVASAQWVLHQRMANGDMKELPDTHPAMRLWVEWNPFLTNTEALEIVQQHLCLVGEAWVLKVKNSLGMTVELWPLRPDRMAPIPDAEDYLKGYRYQIGNTRIDLGVDDIIFVRTPSPIDPYRGIGPIGSMLIDLEGEKAAAQYMASFFRNGATISGYIEVEETLSDPDFERMAARFKSTIAGNSNAWKVAILERAKFHESAYTQRDMQFQELRLFNRDLILGAFGMPRSILGITEDVNRANAEAGMFLFARWVVKPELERIRAAVNDRLIRDFGPDLHLDFIDPTPENKEFNHLRAKEGYQGRYITRNEARALEDLPPLEGGDEFAEPTPSPFALSVGPAVSKALEPAVPEHETGMEWGWRRRLEAEREGLLQFLFPGQQTRQIHVEPGDVDGWDWDWWSKYGEEVIQELEDAFKRAAVVMVPSTQPALLQMRASEWASARAANLLQLSGGINLMEQTRERVRGLVATAIREGQGIGTLAKGIRDDDVFSASRARTIARTETTSALGQGQRQAALMDGREEKRWVTQGDALVRPEHEANGMVGWIDIGDVFPSGQDTIGEGPPELTVNCRCTVIYRHKPIAGINPEEGLGEGKTFKPVQTDYPLQNRCPSCNKWLDSNKPVEKRWCSRCKRNVEC